MGNVYDAQIRNAPLDFEVSELSESSFSSCEITSSFFFKSDMSNLDRSDFLRRRRFLRSSRSWKSGCGWSTLPLRELSRLFRLIRD